MWFTLWAYNIFHQTSVRINLKNWTRIAVKRKVLLQYTFLEDWVENHISATFVCFNFKKENNHFKRRIPIKKTFMYAYNRHLVKQKDEMSNLYRAIGSMKC